MRIAGAKSQRPAKSPKSAGIRHNRGARRAGVGLSLAPELIERLTDAATAQRMSRSAFVARILQRYFETID
jgi:hypothetical protein